MFGCRQAPPSVAPLSDGLQYIGGTARQLGEEQIHAGLSQAEVHEGEQCEHLAVSPDQGLQFRPLLLQFNGVCDFVAGERNKAPLIPHNRHATAGSGAVAGSRSADCRAVQNAGGMRSLIAATF